MAAQSVHVERVGWKLAQASIDLSQQSYRLDGRTKTMDEKEGQGFPQKETLKKKEKRNYYQYLAHQIEREDGLVNTRLNWMLTTQGLFFAALALLAGEDTNAEMREMLTLLLPSIGIVLSIISFLGVAGASIALYDLKTEWEKLAYSKVPRPYGPPLAFWLGLIPRLCLPLLFLGAWGYILFELSFCTHSSGSNGCNWPFS
jgi:hypothetical protein